MTTFNGSLRRSCGKSFFFSFFFSPIDLLLVDRGSLNYYFFQPLLKIITDPLFPIRQSRCSGKRSTRERIDRFCNEQNQMPFSVYRKGRRKRDPFTLTYANQSSATPIEKKQRKSESNYTHDYLEPDPPRSVGVEIYFPYKADNRIVVLLTDAMFARTKHVHVVIAVTVLELFRWTTRQPSAICQSGHASPCKRWERLLRLSMQLFEMAK